MSLLFKTDTALINSLGQPTFDLDSLFLGLPAAQTIVEKSFIKTRTYSKYNGHRRQYDTMRQVISKGSVVTVEFSEALTLSDIDVLKAGFGLYREEGLGQIIVQSNLLQTSQPAFAAFSPTSKKTTTSFAKSVEQNPLVAWVNTQADATQEAITQERIATKIAQGLSEFYQALRDSYKISDDTEFGPGKTQWNAVRSLVVERTLSPKKIKDDLFDGHNTNRGICMSAEGVDWHIALKDDYTVGEGVYLREQFEQLLDEHLFNAYSNKSNSWHCDAVIKTVNLVINQNLWLAKQGAHA